MWKSLLKDHIVHQMVILTQSSQENQFQYQLNMNLLSLTSAQFLLMCMTAKMFVVPLIECCRVKFMTVTLQRKAKAPKNKFCSTPVNLWEWSFHLQFSYFKLNYLLICFFVVALYCVYHWWNDSFTPCFASHCFLGLPCQD